jgi:hypothetical protein
MCKLCKKAKTLEDQPCEDGIIENLLYDAEWCDLDKMQEGIDFIKSKYIITRNPDYGNK